MNILRFAPRLSAPEDAVGRFCARSLRTPAAAELVYLPFVLFRYSVETRGYAGGQKRASGLFLVDLIQATPMNIRAGTAFSVDENAASSLNGLITPSSAAGEGKERAIRVGNQEVAETQVLPALLDGEEAVSTGKRLLRYDLMRLAGGLRYRDWEMAVFPGMTVVHYPFWLIYYRDRRGGMRVGVIDALNGRREGGEIAVSIKKGLMEKKDEKREFCARA